jgi:hypothetical protein
MCEYEVEWDKTSGYGLLHDIQGLVVSFMGAFLEGVFRPRLQCNLSPSPLFSIN